MSLSMKSRSRGFRNSLKSQGGGSKACGVVGSPSLGNRTDVIDAEVRRNTKDFQGKGGEALGEVTRNVSVSITDLLDLFGRGGHDGVRPLLLGSASVRHHGNRHDTSLAQPCERKC